MKATKKIVGAACALVAATALAAGSTFAWFASNGSVSATGLDITVNTTNTYLIIADSVANLSKGANTMSLARAEDASKLNPSAYTAPSDLSTLSNPSNWYTAQGKTSSDGSMVESSKVTLDTEGYEFEDYVVMNSIYISVSEGSQAVTDVTMTLTADPTWSKTNAADSNNDAISLVILYKTKTASEYTKIDVNAANNHGLGTDGKNELSLGGITNSEDYIELQVFVYFDGAHKDVFTANSANLTGTVLDFNFKDKNNAATAPENPLTPTTPEVTEP